MIFELINQMDEIGCFREADTLEKMAMGGILVRKKKFPNPNPADVMNTVKKLQRRVNDLEGDFMQNMDEQSDAPAAEPQIIHQDVNYLSNAPLDIDKANSVQIQS